MTHTGHQDAGVRPVATRSCRVAFQNYRALDGDDALPTKPLRPITSTVTIDPVVHAYATIGLRPGASAQELKQRYKQLVRTWHPDRWANDPVNQAEAAQKMRAINAAYATLHRVQTAPRVSPEPPAPQHEHPADHWSVSHRSMTDEELDAIVNAIGDRSYVSVALRALAWMAPLAGAYVACYSSRTVESAPFREPLSTRDLTMGVLLFATSMAVLLWQKWTDRKRRTSLR